MKIKKIFIILLILLLIFIGYSVSRNLRQPLVETEKDIIYEKDVEKDTTPPELVLKEKELVVTLGSEINYQGQVRIAKDDQDGDLKDLVKYDELDTSRIGDYEVIYRVSDKSGNETRIGLKIKVIESYINKKGLEGINGSN